MSAAELAPGLWRWTARHPDWHPADDFGAEVASYALVAGDELLLVDPLLGDGDHDGAGAVLERLDALAAAATSTHILITIGYHVRSAEPLGDRYAAHIYGPKTVANRLADTKAFTILQPGVPGPAGTVAYAIGSPRRTEPRSGCPAQRARLRRRAVTNPAGKLRMGPKPRDAQQIAFYRSRFAPTLDPLRDLPAQRILTTHGPPILHDGAAVLAAALNADPWFHHG